MVRSCSLCALVFLSVLGSTSSAAKATDCNGNGVADALELLSSFSDVSPPLYIGPGASEVFHIFDPPPAAAGDVTFAFAGSNVGGGFLTVFLNQVAVGITTWSGDNVLCVDRTAQVVIPKEAFNGRTGALVVLDVVFNPTGFCNSAAPMTITTQYATNALPDCNHNGLPDQCDLVPAISPTPPGDCAQAEPVCTGYTYHHSCQNGSSDYYTNSACAINFTTGNVYYKYTPAGSGPLYVAVDYDGYRRDGLQPTVYLYSECPISPDTLLACASGFSGGNTLHQEITTNVTQGNTYYVRVAQYAEFLGHDYTLRLEGPPCLITTSNTGGLTDCNANGTPDSCDIASGVSHDCDGNGIPDECEPDCNHNGIADSCDIASGASRDCNQNGIPDECDITTGTSHDCNSNGIPDECDLASGARSDCNSNRIPDECDFATGALTDCDNNGIADACQMSPCRYPSQLVQNATGIPDEYFLGPPDGVGSVIVNSSITYHYNCGRIVNMPGPDFNTYGWVRPIVPGLNLFFVSIEVSADGQNWYPAVLSPGAIVRIPGDLGQPDDNYVASFDLPGNLQYATYVRLTHTRPNCSECGLNLDAIGAIHALLPDDCNGNGHPNSCDLASGLSTDLDGNGQPDECAADCNNDGVPDVFALSQHVDPDCDHDGQIDQCEITSGAAQDCNHNGVPDACDLASGASQDCNHNGFPDECDIAAGTSHDCNHNGIPDECDIASGASPDCTGNGSPDECDIALGLVPDCNHDGIPDMCEGLGLLTADAGPDHSICPGETIILGGTPPASGGTPPYTFQWLVDGQPRETPTLDQQQTVANGQLFTGGLFQSFTAGTSGELRAVEVSFAAASGSGTLIIYTGNLSAVLAQQNVTLGSGWQHFDLDCPPAVTAGQVYLFDIDSSSGFTINYNTSNPYPGGVLNTNSGWDLVFKTYVGHATGLCQTTDPSPAARPMQTTHYQLQVTDSNGCSSTSPDAVITVRSDNPCFHISALQLGGTPPYALGESVPVTVQLSTATPAGGATVNVTGQNFSSFVLNLPQGVNSGQQDVTMQTLGESFQASAALAGLGGIVYSAHYDVQPLVQSISLSGTPPYKAATSALATVTLREPATLGAAVVHVTSGAFDAVDVTIPAGGTTGSANLTFRVVGTGFTATATAASHCAHSATTASTFDVLPAGDLYVNAATGNDNNDGRLATPFATIGKAIATATDGYFIYVASGTYVERLTVVKNLVILGESADRTIVDAGHAGRPLTLLAPNTITLSGLTFAHGDGTDALGTTGFGGGIYVGDAAALVLADCAVRDNAVDSYGGGIDIEAGNVVLTRCTISGNTSGFLGGGISFAVGSLRMTNCTVSENTAPYGGGLYVGGTTSLSHCTITANAADLGGGISMGSPVTIGDCIVAGNSGSPGHVDFDPFAGGVTSNGYNLIGDPSGVAFGGTDLVGADPVLGPLGMHGGPTATHALLGGSPAIDGGNPICTDTAGQPLTTDQRGQPRPADGNGDGIARCDIGSVERPLTVPADFDGDRDVDRDDLGFLEACFSGPGVPHIATAQCQAADLNGDGDVDQTDFGLWQRCFSGPGVPAKPGC